MAAHDSSTTHPVSSQPCCFPTSPTDVHDYLMLDCLGTVLEVRRMRPNEARDINLELQALNAPYHWERLASMTD